MHAQIASALMYVHSKRVLHRDLKTQNIFIAKGNIIKLGDFVSGVELFSFAGRTLKHCFLCVELESAAVFLP